MKRKGFLFAVFICCILCGGCKNTVEEFSEDNHFEDRNVADSNEEEIYEGAARGTAGITVAHKQAEAEECVRTYFEALSEGDEKKAELYFQEEDSTRGIRIRVGKECGILEYENLQMDVYPLDEEGDEWIFLVLYELAVDGFESRLPGMTTILAYFDDDRWYLSEELAEESKIEVVRSILERDDVSVKLSVCNQAYLEVLEEEEIRRWVDEIQREISEAVSEEYFVEDAGINTEKTEEIENSENAESVPVPEISERYEVQEGDCLWRITQEQLGDGMRWRELYELNQKIIGDDPDRILPGLLLELPR